MQANKMKIEGYQYITHKIIPRPWGIECRFTVARPDGTHINEIVMLNDGLEDEAQIASLIVGKLKVIDVPLETLIPERIYTETEVKNLLDELKTKEELKHGHNYIKRIWQLVSRYYMGWRRKAC